LQPTPARSFALLLEQLVLVGVPEFQVAVFASRVQVVGRVPQLLNVFSLHDIEDLEPNVPQRLDSGIPLDGIPLEFRRNLIGREFGGIRLCCSAPGWRRDVQAS
jgi:hypothetical protein